MDKPADRATPFAEVYQAFFNDLERDGRDQLSTVDSPGAPTLPHPSRASGPHPSRRCNRAALGTQVYDRPADDA